MAPPTEGCSSYSNWQLRKCPTGPHANLIRTFFFSIDVPSFQGTIVCIRSAKTNHHKVLSTDTNNWIQAPKGEKSKGIFINLSPKSRQAKPTRVLLYSPLTLPAMPPSLPCTGRFQPYPSPPCLCSNSSSTFLPQTNVFLLSPSCSSRHPPPKRKIQ